MGFQDVLSFFVAMCAVLCLGLMSACHHHHNSGTPFQDAAIASFTATAPSIAQGTSTTLTAVFTGVSASIDQNLGAVQSGVPVSTGTLTADSTFTLTVSGDGGTSATQTVQVLVTNLHHLAGNAGVAGAILTYTDGTAKTATADGTGAYSLDVSDDWSGTVTPSLTGYAFMPPSRSYDQVLTDLTAQDFTAAVTYSISGNAGLAGASLSCDGGTTMAATADASGNFTLTVPSHWSGTVTPSMPGYTFAPTSRTYPDVQAMQISQNFVSTGITYTVMGNAGEAGVTLAYTDSSAKAVTADAAGAYSFPVSYNWSGTVTPSLLGHAFTPVSRSYTKVLSNQTGQDYVANTGPAITISGNAGLAGAFLFDTDSTKIVATADSNGDYTLTLPYNWSGTVTPGATSYAFTPASRTYTNLQANLPTENYTVTVLYAILGSTQPGTSLAAVGGLFNSTTTTLQGMGVYLLYVPEHWSGTVTPSLPGFTFAPASRAYADVQAMQTGQDFAPTGVTYTVSGNAGAAGATLAYTDGTAKTAMANASGAYSFTVSYNWSGTLAPSLLGHAFTPVSQSFTNVLANQTGKDFVANTGLNHTISGNAGLAGATLAYSDGTVQTATANPSGNYTFNVSYNWSGTVTPGSPLRQVFTPLSRSYIHVLSDQTAQDYTPIPGIFTATPSVILTSPRYGHTSTLLGNGQTLVAGGEGNTNLVNTKLYDPATGTFAPTKDTQGNLTSGLPRYWHTATLLPDGKVLLAGGAGGGLGVQSAELYDPATGLFTATVGPMLTARYQHAATLLPSGKVLLAGGSNFVVWLDSNGVEIGHSGSTLATAELYDPATGRFTVTGSLFGPRKIPTANLLPDGRVLLAGGESYNGGQYVLIAELYDPATGLFTTSGSLVTPREYHTSTLLPVGKVLFIGGQAGSSSELYDPATGLFSTSGPMGAFRRLHTATLLANGKVLVAGGELGFDALDSAELYDSGTGSFSPTGSMVVKRVEHSASVLPGGQVLLTGGYGPDESSEVFDPQDPASGQPWFAYTPAVFHFTKDTAIAAITPQSTGATAWTITPALPLGLGFSPTTGAITGKPTALTTAQAYVVTASKGTHQSSDFIWVLVTP